MALKHRDTLSNGQYRILCQLRRLPKLATVLPCYRVPSASGGR
jgi:hypothetical protein